MSGMFYCDQSDGTNLEPGALSIKALTPTNNILFYNNQLCRVSLSDQEYITFHLLGICVVLSVHRILSSVNSDMSSC